MATTKKKPSTAQLAARKLFAARAKAGTLKKAKRKPAAAKGTPRKPNPLTRVKVKSPSQRSGAAPSKRLVARRKATAKAAPGYYANPKRRPAPAGFCVHHATPTGHAGKAIATFRAKGDAIEYAKAYAKGHRVPVVIVGKGL